MNALTTHMCIILNSCIKHLTWQNKHDFFVYLLNSQYSYIFSQKNQKLRVRASVEHKYRKLIMRILRKKGYVKQCECVPPFK